MNLLPSTEKEILKKGFKLRSIIMALFLLSASFFIGLIVLLPSYFLALGNFSKIAPVNSSLGAKDDDSTQKILNLPGEIDSKLKFLRSNLNNMPAVDSFSKIIGYLPKEITLKSIVFSRSKNYKEKIGTIIYISGTAADRDSLVSFSKLLSESNLFSAVDMPVSNLTKGKNLPFSVNIFIEGHE